MATPGALKMAGKVAAEKADLVILGFGMNDTCFANVPPDQYGGNTSALIEALRQERQDTEIVLLATMPPNMAWEHAHAHYKDYVSRLNTIAAETPGVAVADLTSVFEEILKYKSYTDFSTGLLHPNDFGHRVYADVLLAMFTTEPRK